jgi:MscS family membrane protein
MKKNIFYSIIFFGFLSTSELSYSQLFEQVYYGFSTTTPQKTMKSHLAFLTDDNYHPSISAKTLNADSMSNTSKLILTTKLKEIYEKIDLPKIGDIPNKRNFETDDKYIYTPLPDYPKIYLERYEKSWLYSKETVEYIPVLHDQLFETSESQTTIIIEPVSDTINNKAKIDTIIRANLSSPYHSVLTLFTYTEKSNFHPEISAKVLYAPALSEDEKIIRVQHLKQIFDGKAIRISPNEIPDNPFFKDTTGGLAHKYIITYKLNDFYLVKRDSLWLLSNYSVANIEPLFRKTYVLGSDKLSDFASLMQERYSDKLPFDFDNETWKYIGVSLFILALVIGSLALYSFLKLLGLLLFMWHQKNRPYYDRLIIPLSIYMIISTFLTITPSLGVHPDLLITLTLLGKIIRIIFFMTFFFRLMDFIVHLGKDTYKTKSTYKKGFIPFIGMFSKAGILLIGILMILDNLGLDIKDSLTGLSVLGLALALAAQDTVKNFFGSIMIFLDRPFQVGDWIKTKELSGDVESIGLRTTRIRTYDNSLVSIPNAVLTDSTLDNMGLRNFRRFKTAIRIKYNTPIENIEPFLVELRTYITNHEYTNEEIIRIYLNNYDQFGLKILFDIFLTVKGYDQELEQRGIIISHTIKLAQKHKVYFAVPFEADEYIEKDKS